MSLLSGSSPSTVPRLVVTSWVRVSIEARLWRSFAHVSKEACKILPAVADLDPGAAVSCVGSVSVVLAAPTHVDPRRVEWVLVRHAVCRLRHPVGDTDGTTARLATTVTKMIASCHRSLSAIAHALPVRVTAAYSSKAEDAQAPKALAGQVEAFH